MPAIDHIRRYHDELTATRRDIHANPELGLQEHRTADIVAQKLEEWGIEVHRGVGGTGVVGVLRSGNGHQSIGLRADMDALPIEEATNLPYASQNHGTMHACGHDGHTTILLGAARYLAETRDFNGTVNFIFQPGEEGIGGALAMLKDGLFQRFPCDAIFGLHNRPGMPVGQYGIAPGAPWRAGLSSTSPSPAAARTVPDRKKASTPYWSPAISAPHCNPLSPVTCRHANCRAQHHAHPGWRCL